MKYQVTVRFGEGSQRYHTMTVSAANVPAALRSAADMLPADAVPSIDLVELRLSPDFEKRFPDQDSP
jgi:hypothetical protein